MNHYINAYSGNKNVEVNKEFDQTLIEINEIAKRLKCLKKLVYNDEPFLDNETMNDLFYEHSMLEPEYHRAITIAYLRCS